MKFTTYCMLHTVQYAAYEHENKISHIKYVYFSKLSSAQLFQKPGIKQFYSKNTVINKPSPDGA